MKVKKIEFIKDWIVALVEHDKQPMILIGKADAKLNVENAYDTEFEFGLNSAYTKIINHQTAQIVASFKEHNGKLFTLITLNNKEEFKTIISTLEVIL